MNSTHFNVNCLLADWREEWEVDNCGGGGRGIIGEKGKYV
jgi:hypothetical protein